MTGQLAGRVGLVTGAGKGIGAAIASLAAAQGAAVGALDIDATALRSVTDAITGSGGRALPLTGDVSDFAAVDAAATQTREELGEIDFLVANAGISDYSLMSDGDPQRWRAVVETNLLGVAYAIRAVLPAMKARASGDIVIMASTAGRSAWVGEPIYIATKWGLVGLAQSLRLECETAEVRVTVVEPSIVDTPLVRSTEEGRAELERYRSLSAEDVARSVVFALAQPDGVAINELVLRPLAPGF